MTTLPILATPALKTLAELFAEEDAAARAKPPTAPLGDLIQDEIRMFENVKAGDKALVRIVVDGKTGFYETEVLEIGPNLIVTGDAKTQTQWSRYTRELVGVRGYHHVTLVPDTDPEYLAQLAAKAQEEAAIRLKLKAAYENADLQQLQRIAAILQVAL